MERKEKYKRPRKPAVARRRRKDGYVWVNRSDGRRGLEHRIVMEDILGRRLRPGETVHHKNAVRHDNRPRNLELRVSAHPTGLAVPELLAWAREILAEYEAVEAKLP